MGDLRSAACALLARLRRKPKTTPPPAPPMELVLPDDLAPYVHDGWCGFCGHNPCREQRRYAGGARRPDLRVVAS